MTYFKNNSKLISMLMVTIMLLTAAPYHAAYAKMISTGTTVDTQRVETARDSCRTTWQEKTFVRKS